jgi:hypothetical protein
MSVFVHQESDASITFIVVSDDHVLPVENEDIDRGRNIFSRLWKRVASLCMPTVIVISSSDGSTEEPN